MLTAALTAVLALCGVAMGSALTASRAERKWAREEKLRGIADFINVTGQWYDRRKAGVDEPVYRLEEQQLANAAQAGRSIVHLLCGEVCRDLSEALITKVRAANPSMSQENESETVSLS